MSGGATYVENFSDALRARGVTVEHISLLPGTSAARYPTHVVTSRENWHAGPSFRGHGRSVRRLATLPFVAVKRVDRWLNARRFRKLVDSYGADTAVVFTHVKSRIVLAEAGWTPKPNGPILVGQHHSQFESIDHESWLREALPRWFNDMDAFTALTREDAEKFANLLEAPCYGVGNPMALGSKPVRQTSREPIAVALARLSGEKQLDLMIRAFAAATSEQDLSQWRLHIYGDGDELEYLQKEIVEAGASDRVVLKGRTSDVNEVLSTASVNLVTSRYEGFGMSTLEAAVSGVPTIAFDCSPGVRGLVSEMGILVPAGDESAFTRTLGTALRDPERLADLGKAARVSADRFSPDSIVDRWATILNDCYARREGAA